MGVEVVYPKRNDQARCEGHRIYPYLLEGLEITGPDQVWCSGHHLCADGLRVHVFGGGDGLVEPLRAGLGADQQAGGGFCVVPGQGRCGQDGRPRSSPTPIRAGSSPAEVYRRGGIGGSGREHGRARAVDRQPVHRAAVAERQT